MSDECGLPLISFFDVNVVVPPADVELSKARKTVQVIYEISDERKRIGVLDSMFIQISVVLYQVEFSIFLFDKKER